MGEERRRVDLGFLFRSDLVSICSFVKPGGRASYPTRWSSEVVYLCVTENYHNPDVGMET